MVVLVTVLLKTSRRGVKELITPIRERREELAKDPDYIMDVLRQGTDKCRIITQQTLDEVKDGLGLFKF